MQDKRDPPNKKRGDKEPEHPAIGRSLENFFGKRRGREIGQNGKGWAQKRNIQSG